MVNEESRATATEELSDVAIIEEEEDDDDHLQPRLPDDLTNEVLLRLPIDSIFRLKCVSNTWNHFLSAPSFRLTYLSRLPQSSPSSSSAAAALLGFFHFKKKSIWRNADSVNEDDIRPPLLSFLPTSPQGHPLASHNFLQRVGSFQSYSSNGLILCGDHPTYYVCNPLTHTCFSLPLPNLDLDESIHYTPAGFSCEEASRDRDDGHSLVRQNYKVVIPHIIERSYTKTTVIETYSSKTGFWTESTLTACAIFQIAPGLLCTSIEGSFYWFSKGKLVAYDPNTAENCVWLIKIPALSITSHLPSLTHSQDGLLQCAVDCCDSTSGFRIYMLGRKLPCYSYSNVITEWNLRYVVKLDMPGMVWKHFRLRRDPSEYQFYIFRAEFHPLNPAILYFRMGPRIFCCDVESGRVDLIPHNGILYFNHARFTIIPYFKPEWPPSPLP